MDDISGEKRLLLYELYVRKQNKQKRVYKSRWWVAFILMFSGVLSGMIWSTFGIIAESTKHLFEWTNGDIGTIANTTNFAFIAFVIPVSIVMDTKGLKVSAIGCALLLFIGCGIRCITTDPTVFFVMCCVAGGMAGAASIVPYAGPGLMASTWFPRHQRSLISGIIAFCNYVGVSAAFIVGPQFVPDPVFLTTNNLSLYEIIGGNGNRTGAMSNSTAHNIDEILPSHDIRPDNMKEMLQGMVNLMYFSAGLATLLLLFTLVHFPSKPPTPPSFSASVPRTDYRHAMQTILKNKQHWIIVLVGSLPRGITSTWVSMFDIAASNITLSQVDAGMIAFCSTLIGAVSGLLFSRLSYRLGGRSKELVLVASVIGTIFTVWVALMLTGYLDANLPSLYVSTIAVGIVTYGTVPLFYEMSAEAAFPVGEGVAGGLYTLVLHVLSTLYLAALSIPNIGTAWMTWTVVGGSALSAPLLAIFKENNARSALDKTVEIV